MTDDLDDLKAMMDAELPKADPGRRAEAISVAMKNFDRMQDSTQGNADGRRLTSEHAQSGGIRGALRMLFQTNTRTVLTMTTALAAVGLVAVLPILREGPPAQLPQPGSLTSLSASDDAEEDMVFPEVISSEPTPPQEMPAQEMSMPEMSADVAPMPEPAPSAGADLRTQTLNATRSPSPAVRKAMPSGSVMGGIAASPEAAPAPSGVFSRVILEEKREIQPQPQDSEAFPEAESNPIKVTAEEPVSTFSIDVDTASWSILRNSIQNGYLPPKEAVRIEEMVNYFSYEYPAPTNGLPFATHVGVTESPWREGTQIVQIGLQGAVPAEKTPMDLVFLIDTSGSMEQPNKLPLLKQSFRLMLGQLSAEDRVSIVTYAGSAGRVLDPTPASDQAKILAALDQLQAGGGTAGQAGLQQAYATAEEMSGEGRTSRVILATDGDFNVGISDPEALKEFIAEKRESGVYLSVLGFGRGNLDDATMQALAQTGNGMAAYIDTLSEAQKVLVDQLQGALFPIADDVKIQVEWNPAAVAEYRLIGYETRALKREDFNNDKVDAGEIGAGHQVTALYEITPVGSDARMTDPLRYAASEVSGDAGELGFLRLRYKAPGESVSQLIETPILSETPALPGADWPIAIAGFGQLLKGSEVIGDWSMGDAIALAQGARGDDPFGYRQEAIMLMRLAESLSQ
jgi:Ca-activated chloride channel family protein